MLVWLSHWWFMYFGLLNIAHEINPSFDCDPILDVCKVFLDISKAFKKVWHEGILFKLEKYGPTSKVLTLPINYFLERYQRVVLNGQTFSCQLIGSVVPQGLILGSLFFFIYTDCFGSIFFWVLISDLPDNLESNC